MTPDLGTIRDCFRRALRLSEEESHQVTMEADVWNFPKWNSLGHIALVLELEKAFSVRFDESRTAELVSVQEIVKTLDALKEG